MSALTLMFILYIAEAAMISVTVANDSRRPLHASRRENVCLSNGGPWGFKSTMRPTYPQRVVGVSVFEFYVTYNDISVIYVTAQVCMRTEEEVASTVGLPNAIS